MRMIKLFTFLILAFSLFTGFSGTEDQDVFNEIDDEYVAGQLYVRFTDLNTAQNFSLEEKLQDYEALGITSFKCPFNTDYDVLARTYLLEFNSTEQTAIIHNQLDDLPSIELVERIPMMYKMYTPNDLLTTQWSLTKVNATGAWGLTQGSSDIVIAVIDDAVDINHVDLNADIWVNPGEIAGNGTDDNDPNILVDDVNGWDFADNDNDPTPPSWANSSYFAHGTHVAGIAAGVTDNSTGMASLGFNTSIMCLKVANTPAVQPSKPSGALNSTAIVNAIMYAADNGAHIINMSLGGPYFSSTQQAAVTYAANKGVILVAAAGNSNSSAPMYPAALTEVISVGATDQNDKKASFSNYGSTLCITAPGVGIYSAVPGGYGNKSGTSMACPMVSATIALMLAYDDCITPDDIISCLKSSAVDIDPINPSYTGQLGDGRLDAYAALMCQNPPTIIISGPQNACPNTSVDFETCSSFFPISYSWQFPGGTPSTSTLQNPSISYSAPGLYDVILTVTNAVGTTTETLVDYIQIGVDANNVSTDCPPSVILNNDPGVCGAIHNYDFPSTWNDCGNYTTSISGLPSGSIFPIGITTVSTDVTSGSATNNCSFTVEVIDNEIPIAVCQDVTITPTAGQPVTITPNDVNNGSTDNCPLTLTLDNNVINTCNQVKVTLTASDNSGNSNSCTANVLVPSTSEALCDCDDGIDNDHDGYIDHFDSECPGYSPFTCDGTFYMTSAQGGQYILNQVETNPVSFILMRNLSNDGVYPNINAIGYNPVDNYIYGVSHSWPRKLFRINAKGEHQMLNHLDKFQSFSTNVYAGTFSKDGTYYLMDDDGWLYTVDIQNEIVTQSSTRLSGHRYADLAIDPLDPISLTNPMLYAWDAGYGLHVIDPSTNTIVNMYPNSNYFQFGSLFFDSDGTLYGYGKQSTNAQTELVKIDKTNGSTTLIGNGPVANETDGCSCPFGIDMKKTVDLSGSVQLINGVPQIFAGNIFTYEFEITNSTCDILDDLDFDDVLTNGLTWSSNPYSISNCNISFTTAPSGTATASLEIDGIPAQSTATFSIDAAIPENCVGTFDYLNQAELSNIPEDYGTIVFSDDELTPTIDDPTLLRIVDGTIITADLVDPGNCSGVGDIILTVSNDDNTYSYSWSYIDPTTGTNAITKDLTGVPAGTYTVSVTDNSGCTTTESFTLSLKTGLDPKIVLANTICGVSTDLCLDQTYSTYSWSLTSATTPCINVNSNGTYSVTVTDGGCTGSTSIDINFSTPPAPVFTLSDYNGFNVSCFDSKDGFILTDIPGFDLQQFSFSWPNGTMNSNLIDVGSGNYNVIIDNLLDCTSGTTYSNVLNAPPLLEILIVQSNPILCSGDVTDLSVSITGGLPPYSYEWSTGLLNSPLAGVGPGTYSVTVTDDNGCTAENIITLFEPRFLDISTKITSNFNGEHVNCNGANDGKILAIVTGGVLPYSFVWSNGGSSNHLTNLGAGTYTLTFTDGIGCQKIISETLVEPLAISVSLAPNHTYCDLDLGSITATISGGTLSGTGTGVYLIDWYDGDFSAGGATLLAGNASTFIDRLTPGTYSIVVTDNNGCTATATTTINSIVDPLALDANITHDCDAMGSGAIDLIPTGGCTPYTYSWNPSASTEDISGLSGGTYDVTVTDDNGTTISGSYTINTPAIPLSGSTTVIDESCTGTADGQITVNASGGNGAITYAWSHSSRLGANFASGLSPGTYTVTITDADGCEVILTETVVTKPLVSVVSHNIITNCLGITVLIDIEVDHGTMPYTFAWSNGDNTEDATVFNSGDYYVTITDANQCVNVETLSVVIDPVVSVSLTVTDISANAAGDGFIDATPANGNPPYTFAWSNGATTSSISNLQAGHYTVTVTDDIGCTAVATGTVLEPYGCSDNFYHAIYDATNNQTDVYKFTLVGSTFTNTLAFSLDLTGEFDAFGLNTVDNFAYAISPTYNVYQVGANGYMKNLGVPLGITGTKSFTSGTIGNGIYYVFYPANPAAGGSVGFEIDLNTLIATSLPGGLAMGRDWVFRDGVNNDHLVSIKRWNSTDVRLSVYGLTGGINNFKVHDDHLPAGQELQIDNAYSSMWIDNNNNYYTYNPNNGNLHRIIKVGSDYRAFYIDNVVSSTNAIADGYGCPNVDPQLGCGEVVINFGTGLCDDGTSSGSIVVNTTNCIGTCYYFWDGPTPIPVNTISPTGLAAGTYTVYITDGFGCVEERQAPVETCPSPPPPAMQNTTGIENSIDGTSGLNIKAWPNPFNDEIIINVNGLNKAESINVNLFDLTGKLILSKDYTSSEKVLKQSIQIDDLSDGVYYLTVETKEERHAFKMIKMGH